MSSPATKPLGLCAAAVLIAVAVIAYSCGARAGAAQYRYALSHSPASARLAHRLQAQPTAQPFSRRAAIAVATGAAGLRMNAPEAKAEDLAVVSAPEASSSAPEAAPPAAGTGSGGGSLAQPLAAYAVGLGVFQFQRRQYVASLTSEDFAKCGPFAGSVRDCLRAKWCRTRTAASLPFLGGRAPSSFKRHPFWGVVGICFAQRRRQAMHPSVSVVGDLLGIVQRTSGEHERDGRSSEALPAF